MAEINWIPIDHNWLLLSLTIVVLIGGLLLVIRKKVKIKELPIIAIPALLLFVMIFAGFALPSFSTGDLETVDYTIHITARIKPWTYNVTSITDVNGTSEVLNSSDYEILPSGVDYPAMRVNAKIRLRVNKIYKLVFKAIDTDHGLFIEDLLDYYNNIVHLTLPQHKEKAVYFRPRATDIGNYAFLCTTYCGAFHGEMNGVIILTL